MARRRFNKRRPKRSTKRTYRKKRYRTGQRIYQFTRFADFYTITTNNITDTLGAINFALNDVPGYTEFTALYDAYKINAVKIMFLPQMTSNISVSSVNNPYANTRFFSCIDYNDSTAPANVDAVREYKSCKYTPILRRHKRYIYKPKILAAEGYTPVSPWISCASPSVIYYGLKYAIENTNATVGTAFEYSVECKFYLSFKNVK